jgi:hypothetical protein
VASRLDAGPPPEQIDTCATGCGAGNASAGPAAEAIAMPDTISDLVVKSRVVALGSRVVLKVHEPPSEASPRLWDLRYDFGGTL